MDLFAYLQKNKGVINIAELESRLTVSGKECPRTTFARYFKTGKMAKKWKDAAAQYIAANLDPQKS